MSCPTLFSKFHGTVLGAISGDCLGAKFEKLWASKPYNMVTDYFADIENAVKIGDQANPFVSYTDDSCMTFDLGESLVRNNGYDSEDVAKSFTDTFFESWETRKYGIHVKLVFSELKFMRCTGEIYRPAQRQFNGGGSYGNGSAMRVSPVPLFHHNDIANIVKLASDQSRLTHAHPSGINGAILQALAIEKALHEEEITDSVKFCKELWEQLSQITIVHEELPVYEQKLKIIRSFLKGWRNASIKEINDKIGSNVAAREAVPAALFSFLYTLDKRRIPQLSKYNGFCRAVIFAVAISADSDTIGSMTGAIAGAYYGVEAVPKEWITAFEGADSRKKLV